MSEQSAADIIAGALDAMPADPRPATLVNRDRASASLAALEAAGYAVVKLPPQCAIPNGWNDHCLGAWQGPAGEDPVSAWATSRYGYSHDAVAMPGGDFISIADARALAAALLAAAREADNA